MKIFYAASTASHIESFHLPYLKWLCGRGDEVHVAAPTRPEGLPETAVYVPMPLKKSIGSLGNFATAFQLGRRFAREKYDIIHVHTTLAAYFVRLGVKLAGVSARRSFVVNTVHGYLFAEGENWFRRKLYLAAEKSMRRVTNRVVTMNDRDTGLAERYRLSRGDVQQIEGMGVRFNRFIPSAAKRQAARDSFGFGDETVLVFAGEFSRRKNQAFLISALKQMPSNYKLLLPGQGELLGECKALAASLGLGSRVLFPGQMPDVERAYFAADLFVSASRSEGLPFAMMEAMRAGLPQAVSAVAGQTDLVGDHVTGYLYPAGDTQAYLAAVEQLADLKRRRRFGKRSISKVKRYSIRSVFARNVAAGGYLRHARVRKSDRRNAQ